MIPLSDDQPTRSFPFVTIGIIIVNFLVFAWWQQGVGLDQSVALAGLFPAEVTTHEPGGITHMFTSMFMHAGWMHLIGNMWFLWIFGNNIEDVCGHFRFVAFYVLAGVAAAGAHILAEPLSTVPLVGASGAISAVLGAYLLKHPQARIRTLVPISIFIRIIDIPAVFFLLIWIGLQVFSQVAARGHTGGGGVAYLAHIGGFVAGMILIFIFQDYSRRPHGSLAVQTWSRHKRDERTW